MHQTKWFKCWLIECVPLLMHQTKWFKCWLIECVPLLMHQTKWFKSDRELNIGDLIIFKKAEKELKCKYQYGIIKTLRTRKDGLLGRL